MQKLKKLNYEGKNEDDLLNEALKALNASSEEVYYNVTEEVGGGLFKSKKYKLSIALKDDVVSYIKDFLKEIIEKMGLSVNFEVQKRETFVKINMVSNNNPVLIGKNGKMLSSLQAIVRQAVQNNLGFRINIVLDVEGYAEDQEKKIEKLAVRLAKDVVSTGIEVKMD